MTPIRNAFDIPFHVQKGDIFLRLAEDLNHPGRILDNYVVHFGVAKLVRHGAVGHQPCEARTWARPQAQSLHASATPTTNNQGKSH